MNNTNTRKYETLQRVQAFGRTYRDRFPAGSVGANAFTTIDGVLTRLDAWAGNTPTPAPDRRVDLGTARAALFTQLEAIRRSARAIARTEPGFDVPFHIPNPRQNRRVLAAARTILQEATARQDRFVAWGMPANVVAALTEAADAFEASLGRRQSERDGLAGARAGVDAAVREGLTAVAQLDVIVANGLADDPSALAVWEGDRKVERFRRAKAQGGVVTPETPKGPTALSGEVPKAA